MKNRDKKEPDARRKKAAAPVAPSDGPRTAASAFSGIASRREVDLQAPEDAPAEDVASLD
jgi:hypothetical protein